MSINNPITKPSQMKNPIICSNVNFDNRNNNKDIWWAKGKKPNPANSKEAAKMEKMLILRDRLLSFGGEEGCMPLTEDDYDAIMQRGQLFYGKGSRLRKGKPSRCHENSCLLWEANENNCSIATGYALSEDGMWRQHSWVVQPLATKYRVWETTVKRVAYFGFIMTNEECKKFCDNCL